MLSISHLETSGNVNKDLHPPKIPFILVILFIFHSEISGSDVKDEHKKT